MKTQNAVTERNSARLFEHARRIVLSGPGKLALALVLLGSLTIIAMPTAADDRNERDGDDHDGDGDWSRIQRGFAIAPVPLDSRGKNRALLGLGSYIVNAQGGCNDCHTVPSYAPGHDPFQGQPAQVNSATYLGGGRAFGPVTISKNITPDENGLPAGLTRNQFITTLRTGLDEHGARLQVMPWPVYAEMTDRDLKAIYEYLRSIPSLPGPGPR